MYVYRYQRRLHWSECDPAGIVFAPNYARWMVEGVNEMLLSLGFDPHRMIDDHSRWGMPLLELTMKFLHAPKLHETVAHEIAVLKLGSKSLTFQHRMLRDEQVLMEATEARVWAIHDLRDATLLQTIAIPIEVKTALSVRSPGTRAESSS